MSHARVMTSGWDECERTSVVALAQQYLPSRVATAAAAFGSRHGRRPFRFGRANREISKMSTGTLDAELLKALQEKSSLPRALRGVASTLV